MAWFFAFFLVSGFCSLVYEVVWLRLAMAAFGVTTPFVSLVLSVFMAGLALGSWGVGRLARRLSPGPASRPLRLYALLELIIGISGLVVPPMLVWGRERLAAGGVAWDSSTYYLVSGAWMTLTLLPFCVAMGATFPLAMAAIRCEGRGEARESFSYLYLANVIGATAGTVTSAFVLIELLGLRTTLLVTATLNVALAAVVLLRSRSAEPTALGEPRAAERRVTAVPAAGRSALALLGLFMTGLVSMALEVVWVRQFTPYLGTLVYAFAGILAIYLLATFLGSGIYRTRIETAGEDPVRWFLGAWIVLGLLALLPLLTTDPRLELPPVARLVAGITPFCAAVGFLTPMLVDRWSAGDPGRAGTAYAVNVVGSILGPLLAGFWLLPILGERGSALLLAAPLFAVALVVALQPAGLVVQDALGRARATTLLAGALLASIVLVPATAGFETLYPAGHVRRDHTATVIAAGDGFHRKLLVNGRGITKLTMITKMMAHLPLAALDRPPQDALVIALGMGTTFRSLLSWNISATAVELVPSVPPLFGFFHADAPALVRSPRARIVVDDGRRFLERTAEQYDVITLDPSPPVEATGSSLLYSREFYAVAKKRLRPGGILQQWLPGGELTVVASATRALTDSFPHVRVFHGLAEWGGHFLASTRPIELPAAAGLAARVPASAVADLLEWVPGTTAEKLFQMILDREVTTASLLAFDPSAPALSDDRPYNEYFFLRYYLGNSR